MVLKSEDNEIKYLCEIKRANISRGHSSPEADKYVFAYTIKNLKYGGSPCEVN